MSKNKLYFTIAISVLLIAIAIFLIPVFQVPMHLQSNKINNPHVNELLIEIRKIESVIEAGANTGGGQGSSFRIEISVEDGFTEADSILILNLAREYLDKDTVSELMLEFNQKYPPDTNVYIRDKDRNVLFEFQGSYYKPLSERNASPDYAQYEWSQSE